MLTSPANNAQHDEQSAGSRCSCSMRTAVQSLWNKFCELPGHGNLDHAAPQAIQRTGIIQRGLAAEQHRHCAGYPRACRDRDAWLWCEYAKGRRSCSGHRWVGDAHAHPERRDIHHGLVVHDGGSGLIARIDSINGQYGQLAGRNAKAAP